MTYPSENIINLACATAEHVFNYNSRHGCVIYNKKNIISTGFNKKRRLPILYKHGYSKAWLHAESDAILKADREDLKGASLLVVRIGKTKLKNSKPCKHCFGMMLESGIDEVYYSDVEGNIVGVKIKYGL